MLCQVAHFSHSLCSWTVLLSRLRFRSGAQTRTGHQETVQATVLQLRQCCHRPCSPQICRGTTGPLVQHCCEAADILHEREWEHTNESQTIADEGQVPENDQANQTTKQHKQPKHNQNKPNKKPQPNKRKQQNQPFTLVRRRAQVARPGLEQSKKKLTRMHRHALRL